MASTLSRLKKYGSDPTKGAEFRKLWGNASDKDRNAYRNHTVKLLNRSSATASRLKSAPAKRAQAAAMKKRSSGGRGG